jgi:hypothetical protein
MACFFINKSRCPTHIGYILKKKKEKGKEKHEFVFKEPKLRYFWF